MSRATREKKRAARAAREVEAILRGCPLPALPEQPAKETRRAALTPEDLSPFLYRVGGQVYCSEHGQAHVREILEKSRWWRGPGDLAGYECSLCKRGKR